MKKFSAIIFLSMVALLGLWACGDGDLKNATDADYLAVERYANISAEEIADIMGKCDGDAKCIAATMDSLQLVEVDSTDEDTTVSSSSSKKDEEEAESSSSAADTLSSSATEADSTVSSSSVADTVVTSSDSEEETESSDSVEEESSSSETATSSASRVRSSSSEAEDVTSSSSEAESSSDAEAGLPVDGSCTTNVTNAYLGNSVTWTFTPSTGARQHGTFEWTDGDADESVATQSGYDMYSVTMTYSYEDMVGEKVAPTLSFEGSDFECTKITIIALPKSSSSVAASSSSVSSSSSSAVSSSSSVKSSSSTGNSSSSTAIIIIDPTKKSSSSTAASSSSAAESSDDTSSTEESSSSEETATSSESSSASSGTDTESSDSQAESSSDGEEDPYPNASLYCADRTKMIVATEKNISLGTENAVCLVITSSINGFGTSNVTGRTFTVNGEEITSGSVALSSDGYTYVYFTAGTPSYASFYYW